MDITIRNHSDGVVAGVTSENQLQVEAEVHQLQHHVSRTTGQSYQVLGVTDTLTAATIPILHITNDDPDRALVISFIRSQIVDSNTTLPTITEYFQYGFGTTISGGTAVVPVNQNRKAGSAALVTCLHSTPTSAGTFIEDDRWYPQADGDKEKYDKQGSIILGLNDSWESRIVSASTAGIAWTRVTFMMMHLNGQS